MIRFIDYYGWSYEHSSEDHLANILFDRIELSIIGTEQKINVIWGREKEGQKVNGWRPANRKREFNLKMEHDGGIIEWNWLVLRRYHWLE